MTLENYYTGNAEPRKMPELAIMFNQMALRNLAMHLEFDSIGKDGSLPIEVRIHFAKRARACFNAYLRLYTLGVRNGD